MTTLSATEVKNRFGAVLREVNRTGNPIVVERDGRPVAVILSMQAYEETQRDASTRQPDQLELARSAFGMWGQRDDVDDDWLERTRQHWQSDWADG